MKLLQLNMWMGRLTRQIMPFIEREQPDVITTQEVFSAEQPSALPDAMLDLYQRLQAAGYPYGYFSPTIQLQVSGQTVQFGNAILSKYPILSQETLFTNGAFQPNANSPSFDINTRNAQVVLLSVDDATVTVVNHHGYWEQDPHGSDETVAAMRILADRLKHIEGPLIFAGDLNVDPGTPAMQLFDGWLEDLTATHSITNTLSVLGKVQGVACDHILVSPDVIVHSYGVRDDIVSDHVALVLECEL